MFFWIISIWLIGYGIIFLLILGIWRGFIILVIVFYFIFSIGVIFVLLLVLSGVRKKVWIKRKIIWLCWIFYREFVILLWFYRESRVGRIFLSGECICWIKLSISCVILILVLWRGMSLRVWKYWVVCGICIDIFKREMMFMMCIFYLVLWLVCKIIMLLGDD